MAFGLFSTVQVDVSTNVSEQVQEVIILSSNSFIVILESCIQLWKIHPLELVRSLQSDDVYYWSPIVPLSESTIAFIDMGTRVLCKLDLEKSAKQTLLKLPSEMIVSKLEGFQQTNTVMVVGTTECLSVFLVDAITKEVSSESFQWECKVNKYDQGGSYVVFDQPNNNPVTRFKFVTHGATRKYQIPVKGKALDLNTVIKYSQTACLLCFSDVVNGNFNGIVYSLQKEEIIRAFVVPMFVERIMKFGNQVVGFRLLGNENKSLRLQAVDILTEDTCVKEIQLPDWGVFWGHGNILMLRNQQEMSQTRMLSVWWVPKQGAYTYLLQKSGLSEQFGNEIVRITLENLSQ